MEQLPQNTYCMLAKDLQISKKRQANLHTTRLGERRKEKENRETRESGWDPCLWEGAMKEEQFPHAQKPPH